MKERKKSNRKPKKRFIKYELHSSEDAERFVHDMLLFNKSTDDEPDEDRKTLSWLRDYITNYGPDHGVYLEKAGVVDVRIDPTSSGYQAANGHVSNRKPKKHEWIAEYTVHSYEDGERCVYDWLRFDKRMSAKRRKYLMGLCDYMTYYGPDHVYVDKAGHLQIDTTASGYQASAARQLGVIDEH